MIILMNSRTRFEFVKRIIKLIIYIILIFRIITQILIIYFDKLLKNRNLFFELQYSLFLKYIDEIYIYIINAFFLNNINKK